MASILVWQFFVLVVAVSVLSQVDAQPGSENGANGIQFRPLNRTRNPHRRRNTCLRYSRTLSGLCNNLRRPEWGAAGTPHLIPRNQPPPLSTKGLPSARLVSNVLCSQTDVNMHNKRRLSELVVFFGQFLDHTFTSTPTDKSKPMHIPIPPEDPIFYNFTDHILPFHRSVTSNGKAINSHSSFVDLSTIYSSNIERLHSLRRYRLGMLRTSYPGRLLPLNIDELVNSPTKSKEFFFSGDHRSNEHPVLTALHTLFLREHNRLCGEMHIAFPKWSDSKLFEMAKKVNSAQFQKIVFEEWYPQLTGRKLPSYKRYNPKINPSISSIFATAAFRLGHTMIGNEIKRKGKTDGEKMAPMKVDKMFFSIAKNSPLRTHGIEPFLRGIMVTRAQEVDTLVVPALRNFLFKNIRQEEGFDLIALNIQRGRDHGLPSYNDIRAMFGRKKVQTFKQITRNFGLQSKLQTVYGHVNRVEAWVGLVSEDHAFQSSLGVTALKIFEKEFMRLRDGDRFYFRRWWMFSPEIRKGFPRLSQMLKEKSTMKEVILRNSEITEYEMAHGMWSV